MIKILIVEDSDVIAFLLTAIIQHEPDLEVVGRAKTGDEAVAMAAACNPDLITMDIRMPGMDGLTAIRMIMSSRPKPIVVISSNVNDELQISFKAIDEGALAVLEKPCDIEHPDFKLFQKKMLETIRAMAEVPLIKRRLIAESNLKAPVATKKKTRNNGAKRSYQLIAVGCSTGGPQALKQILSALPADFPLPVVIVQHIAYGFIHGLAEWLNAHSLLTVKVAEAHEVLSAGHVYLAPDNCHCSVLKTSTGYQIGFSRDEPIGNFRPAINALFRSVAKACPAHSIGIILSGMGSDGVEGLLAMRTQNCLTIAQDEQSSIVFGMPAIAIEKRAVTEILAADQIAGYLLTTVH